MEMLTNGMEIHQQMEWRHTSKLNGHTQTMEGDTPNKMEIHQQWDGDIQTNEMDIHEEIEWIPQQMDGTYIENWNGDKTTNEMEIHHKMEWRYIKK